MQQLTITRPDDWHLHLRDGSAMPDVLAHTAEHFGRAIVMPNLTPPVTTVSAALKYRERILDARPEDNEFQPLMTLYLTESTSVDEIDKAMATGHIVAAKLYPAGATTNSAAGVKNIQNIYPVLERMQAVGMVLCVHGEVVDHDIDIFDREPVFVERTLRTLVQDFPTLRIVAEHITTREAALFVEAGPETLAATITPQHLLYNRNALLVGGVKPHYYCLPILKRETHRQELLRVATSGSNKFFLGTDSAPHPQHLKENACGCAGCYSAHAALELYAEAFDSIDALDKLEAFASHNGPDFYQLPRNTDTVTLIRGETPVPSSFPFGEHVVTPLRAGESVAWHYGEAN